MEQVRSGERVVCREASIDRKLHKGSTGVVTGFARFSSYHAREAMVRFDDGSSEWFWLRDLDKVQEHDQ
jgi:hypothetical protein